MAWEEEKMGLLRIFTVGTSGEIVRFGVSDLSIASVIVGIITTTLTLLYCYYIFVSAVDYLAMLAVPRLGCSSFNMDEQ